MEEGLGALGAGTALKTAADAVHSVRDMAPEGSMGDMSKAMFNLTPVGLSAKVLDVAEDVLDGVDEEEI